LQRDLLLTARRPGQWINPLVFFVIVVALFPLGLEPGTQTLMQIGPGVIWVGALLATLLSLDGILRSDYQDGSLEQMLLSHQPLPLMCFARILAHWLTTGLPLIAVAPLLALLMQMPAQAIPVLMLTLLLGTPVLSLVGTIGVSLTVGLPRGGLLLALLILPLYTPVLIFASRAVNLAMAGLPFTANLYLLGALLALSLVLAPLAVAAGLRISLS
jgi:heme exporter protein B